MGIRSTLSSVLSSPLAAVIEARVHELVDELLGARELADPAAVRDLSVQIERVRRATDELRTEVASCRDAVAALGGADEDDDDLALRVAALSAQGDDFGARLTAVQARLQGLGDELVALRTAPAAPALEAAPAPRPRAPRAPAADPAPAPVVAEASPLPPEPGEVSALDRGCKVPGCTAPHRARGFCGRHYQMWKRGTLAGFVSADGTVFFEGDDRRWRVDASLAGEPAEKGARGLKVAGKRASAASA